ncbi:hypothetical protein [Prescottella equi]
MPKERITHDTHFHINEAGAHVPANADGRTKQLRFPQVAVHWGNQPGSHVQLGIQIDRVNLLHLVASDDETIDLYTDSLTREQLDHAIAALTRARDKGYADA